MKTIHASDKEIQQYTINKLDCEIRVAEHIHTCAQCNEAVLVYRELFIEIKDSPKASFDFDLSNLVLEQIPSPRRKFSLSDFPVHLVGISCFIILCLLAFSMRGYLTIIFPSLSTMMVLLISFSSITLLGFLSIETYKTYQDQLRKLDFF